MKREPPEPWTKERWKELKLLDRLLNECTSLNSGNGIIQRITYLIETAEQLKRWDDDGERKGFFHFLQDHAIAGAVPVPEAQTLRAEVQQGGSK